MYTIDSAKNFKRVELENGLVALLFKRNFTQNYYLCSDIGFGSVNEKPKDNGVLHFFEHMAFRKTKNFEAYEGDKVIEKVGGESNAYTAEENTCYIIEIPFKTLPLETGFKLAHEEMFNTLLAKEEVDIERGTIIQELKMYHDDISFSGCLGDLFKESMYKKNPAKMPIGGTIETVSGITSKTLQDYRDKFYMPANMTLAVVGNFDEKEALKLIDKYYAKKKNHGNPTKFQHLPFEPNILNEKVEQREDIEQANFAFGFNLPNLSLQDYLALGLANNVLAMGFSCRLMDPLRKEKGLIYHLDPTISKNRTFCYYSIATGVNKKNLNLAKNIILDEFNKFKKQGLPEKEFQEQKSRMIVQHNTETQLNSDIADELLFFEKHDSAENFFNFEKLINSMKSDDVHRVINSLFDTDNYTFVAIAPKN